jgi:hypothetical protein
VLRLDRLVGGALEPRANDGHAEHRESDAVGTISVTIAAGALQLLCI